MSSALHSPDQQSAGLLGAPTGSLNLRVRGSNLDGRIVRIRSKRCAIGSAAQCGVRLQAERVRPVHCVIFRGAHGAVVRRWSPDTSVNGEAFEDAWLRPGDRLAVGPVEFEVLDDDQADRELHRGDVAESRWASERQRLFEQLAVLEHQIEELRREQVDVTSAGELDQLRDQLRLRDLKAEQSAEHWERERMRLQADLDDALREKQAQTETTGELESTRLQLSSLQSALDDSQRQFATLTDELSREKSLTDQLRQECAERADAYAEVTLHIERLQDELLDLQQQVADAAEVSEQARQLAQQFDLQQRYWRQLATQRGQQLSETEQAFEDERQDWRARLAQAENSPGDSEELQQQLDSLHAQRDSLQAEQGSLQSQWETERAQWETERGELQAEGDRHREQLAQFENDRDERETELEQLTARLAALEAELAHFTDASDRRAADAAQVEQAWETERSDWQTQLQNAQGERDALNGELQQRQGELDELVRRHDEDQSRWAAEVAGLEEQLSQAAASGVDEAEVAAEREELRRREEAWSDERQEWETTASELRSQLAVLTAESQEEHDRLREEVSELNSQLASDERADNSNDDGELTAELEQVRGEFEAAQAKWADDRSWLERELEHRGEKLDEQQTLLVEVREKLEEISQEREQLELDLIQLRQEGVASAGAAPVSPIQPPETVERNETAPMQAGEPAAQTAAAMSFLEQLNEADQAVSDPAATAGGEASADDADTFVDSDREGEASSFVLDEEETESETDSLFGDLLSTPDKSSEVDETPAASSEEVAEEVAEDPWGFAGFGEPAAEESRTEESEDVFSRLESAGLLKDENESPVDAESGNGFEPLTDEEPTSVACDAEVIEGEHPAEGESGFQPVSFIDSYVSEETADGVEDSNDESSEQPPVKSWRSEPAPAPEAAESNEEDRGEESDESIESYMSRLLQRVRGEDEEPAEPQPTNAAPDSYKTADVPAEVEPNEQAAPSVAPVDSAASSDPELMRPEEYRPRSSAPEAHVNLSAMRELANDSARAAITTHECRSWDDNARTKTIMAGTAFGVGAATVLLGGPTNPLAILGGAAAASISAVWLKQARGSTKRSRAISAEADEPAVSSQKPAENRLEEHLGSTTPSPATSNSTDLREEFGGEKGAELGSESDDERRDGMREELRDALVSPAPNPAAAEPNDAEHSVQAQLDAFERELLDSE